MGVADSLAVRVISPDQAVESYPLRVGTDLICCTNAAGQKEEREEGGFEIKSKLRICYGAWHGPGILRVALVRHVDPGEAAAAFEALGVSTAVPLTGEHEYHLVFRASVK